MEPIKDSPPPVQLPELKYENDVDNKTKEAAQKAIKEKGLPPSGHAIKLSRHDITGPESIYLTSKGDVISKLHNKAHGQKPSNYSGKKDLANDGTQNFIRQTKGDWVVAIAKGDHSPEEIAILEKLHGTEGVILAYVVDYGPNETRILMPKCDGDLIDFAKDKSKPKDKYILRKIYTDIATTLKKMHKLKIVHLDLKPENILIKDGKIYITDFGHAQQIGKDGTIEYRLYETGTPGYQPDELAPNAQSLYFLCDNFKIDPNKTLEIMESLGHIDSDDFVEYQRKDDACDDMAVTLFLQGLEKFKESDDFELVVAESFKESFEQDPEATLKILAREGFLSAPFVMNWIDFKESNSRDAQDLFERGYDEMRHITLSKKEAQNADLYALGILIKTLNTSLKNGDKKTEKIADQLIAGKIRLSKAIKLLEELNPKS